MKTLRQYKSFHHSPNNKEKYIPDVNWCEVCDVCVQLDNDVIRHEHENGKKHQQNICEIKYVDIETTDGDE
jgi:uncharacterized protein (DUF4415 family)